MHDTPQEISQPHVMDWYRGECEAIPGRTMPQFTIVERDYGNIFNRFISYGHREKMEGMGEHGIQWEIDDLYDDFLEGVPAETWNGEKYISLAEARDAANVVLHFAPETNGEAAYRGFRVLEEITGMPLADLAGKQRSVRHGLS